MTITDKSDAVDHSVATLRFLVDLLDGMRRQFDGRLLHAGKGALWSSAAKHREMIFDPVVNQPDVAVEILLADANAMFADAPKVRFWPLPCAPQLIGVFCHSVACPVGHVSARVRVWMDFPETIKWAVDYIIEPVDEDAGAKAGP